jgi:hypothetical protein
MRYYIHHDHDSGRPIRIEAETDRSAKGLARGALRDAGFRVDTTFRPDATEDGDSRVVSVQGWNLGRHEGCATAVLVRVAR